MRWSEDEYREWKEKRKGVRFEEPKKAKMNKTETRYAQLLDALKHSGEVLDWWFESMKFRIADRTWYTPDFVVLRSNGVLEVVEIKGFLRDDASVKFKTCREMYYAFDWRMLSYKQGEWQERLGG